jgi:hypothetical protein
MANEHLLNHLLSVDSAFGDAQPDANASIGGFASSTDIADHQAVLVSHVNSQIDFRATSLAGGLDLVGAWLVFYDSNLNEVRQVQNYQSGVPNRFFLFEPLPNTILVGDRFSIFKANSLFESMDGDRCRRRASVHRLGYIGNVTGSQVDDVRLYVRDINAGPLICTATAAAFTWAETVQEEVDTIADQETAPALDQSAGFGVHPQALRHSRDWARATRTPYALPGVNQQASIRDSTFTVYTRAFWVRLEFDLDAPIPLESQAVFQVFTDSDDGTVASSFLVVVDIDSVPHEVVTVVDRRLRIAGGARLSAFLRDTVDPFELVPGSTIAIELDSGPGSMNAQSDTVQRDDAEPIRRVYISPTDPADVGLAVDFRFEVT